MEGPDFHKVVLVHPAAPLLFLDKIETSPPADCSLVTGKKGDSAKQAGGGWISDAWATSNFAKPCNEPKEHNKYFMLVMSNFHSP